MKTKLNIATLCLIVLAGGTTHTAAQITAFTYQGRLNLNGAPASGLYDFMFRLMSDPTNGVAAPVIPINLAVPVTNGLFITGMDFGGENFDGVHRWLEINVRTNGGGSFTTLSPRQFLTPTPYAITANAASNLLAALPAAQISGTILNASLPASPSFSGTVTANNFSGNGANLTNVNAATLGGLNSSNFWRTTGNAGTIAGAHFVGTTDNRPLELKVNNQRALRIEDNGDGSSDFDTLPDGAPNLIGGSPLNFVGAGVVGATVAGGGSTNWLGSALTNAVHSDYGTVGGGLANQIDTGSFHATVSGGYGNKVESNSFGATISGGRVNNIQVSDATIGGGLQNTIRTNCSWATIGGGWHNTVQNDATLATIGGGQDNLIRAGIATIGGGSGNTIESGAYNATIAGGWHNNIYFDSGVATIGGGRQNTIWPGTQSATIGGGYGNMILTDAAYATIPGGSFNSATNYAFACGNRAKATHQGAFVWGDSTDADLASTNANSVTMRASGGYRLFSDSAATVGAYLAPGSGSWTAMSDRNVKENFRAADARSVLEKLIALPVQTWNYKSQDASIRHIGPMAQDFKAAFCVGESETGIATVDADGVALAAIQGLNQKVENLSGELKRSVAENAELKQELGGLKQLMNSIAHKLNGGAE